MKSLLLATVLVSFLVNMACAKPPPLGPSISDVAGVWVTEGSVNALHETFLPRGANQQLTIDASGDGKTFKLYYSNVTEGIGYQLLGLDRTSKAGEYTFRMGMELPWGDDSNPRPGRPFRVRVLLTFDDMGHVTHITLPDACFGFAAPEDRFVRIPVRWSQHINSVIFAGKWKDERGDIFSFDESGKGHRPDGGLFTYEVALTLGSNTLTTCHFEASGHPCQNFLFKRIGNELRFFRRASFQAGSGYEETPFLVLKKE